MTSKWQTKELWLEARQNCLAELRAYEESPWIAVARWGSDRERLLTDTEKKQQTEQIRRRLTRIDAGADPAWLEDVNA